MATYKAIAAHVKKHGGGTVKTCWIAHVKELNSLPLGDAPNRYDENERTNPCPDEKRSLIEDAMRRLGMLSASARLVPILLLSSGRSPRGE